jgi:hypothetical protein
LIEPDSQQEPILESQLLTGHLMSSALGTRPDTETLANELRARYGEFLTLAELSALLRFPSEQAASKAMRLGRFPIKTFKFPHRRGWFASVGDVADYLASLARRPMGKEESMTS